ncbi:hypothetical protein TVAG_164210 [Trichomonas vaginalis G3]|uniref:Post-transcriptional regulator MKT1 C-terminal domain-containing protein n=1 Tax=Trichomonas vaginalis (strain ATCC PRA-98 / G3) TaxID=412133 RepID=A2E1W3_TRIV3|nr:temperature dependent protein affecting M2 dsRNA replication family [Trichomonas vaginalis G3]EAY13312.1 hypothetical protein TVAG_164210 [Trichomonas vaginalis G3]KAI5540421.1 temperature dependent protein affecting M2 dsRNA replication family [Trichomonas vaginalis G3]|eukprot:XP_001325535.1 hypothetical protein [Trichomonas vaginalis G3]
MQIEAKVGEISVPVIASTVKLEGIGQKFYIGIDLTHFFQTYLLKSFPTGSSLADIVFTVQTMLDSSLTAMRSKNVEPIFVYDGIIQHFFSYCYSFLFSTISQFLKEHDVKIIYAPSYSQKQLSYMYKNKMLNAIFSDTTIALQDISSWISHIKFETMEALIFQATPSTIKQLMQIPHASNAVFSQVDDGSTVKNDKLPENQNFITPSIINSKAESCICAGIICPPRIPRPPCGPSAENPIISLPRNCVAYLNDISDIYISIFKNFSGVTLSELFTNQECPRIDEFLPLMLQQNPLSTPLEDNNRIISNVLAAQNIVSRSFTTLFETMRSISTNDQISVPSTNDNIRNKVITESVRRFLTAHEYIAPGGGLSPWGRAVLNSNSGYDVVTINFIEMVRADAMDAEVDSALAGSVGVTEIIERTFLFFPTKTPPPPNLKEKINTFQNITKLINHALILLYRLIAADTYYEFAPQPNIQELTSILAEEPFRNQTDVTTGTLMRFLLEASEDRITQFADSVEDYDQLLTDVKSAFNWWNSLNRATRELKQRSLKPNSRVSNLKNFLILFECADQFVQKRMVAVQSILEF